MLYFIVNPNSGGAKGYLVWKEAELRLQKLKIDYKVFLTTGPGDAIEYSRQITNSDDDNIILVPVGGDGTFNEVLNGANITDRVTFGYMPTGTGNDLARGLKLSFNVVKSLETILSRKNIIEMDYGVLTVGSDEVINRRFAVSTGIGYDAQVCVTIDQNIERGKIGKINLNKQVYLILGALDILKIKPVKGHIVMDNDRKTEFNDIIFISTHNHITEGGGRKFAPQADCQDGVLNLCIMHTKTKLEFAKLLAAGLGGNHLKYSGVRAYDCRTVNIHFDEPRAVHTDGEVLGFFTDCEVHCVKKGIRIIT
ncbi:MAG: YegS/Rv2252/BmrU family lipid kinase [Lachnospiraceae bacterium]|nr:YegS/Rv2252/BmrU family lipid kinase [Lachnospiraceae bacterium]